MRRFLVGLVLLVAVPAAGQGVRPFEPVLVVPFENTAKDASAQWLSEASALLLTRDLERYGAAVITRDERLKAFDRLGLPASALLSQATIFRVAQLIAATHAVVGSVSVKDKRVELRVRTIRIDSGRIFEEVAEGGPVEELFAVTDRLARRMVWGRTTPAAPAERPPLQAFELYVKGLLAETPAAQVRLYQAALAIAADYDAARIALWHVHTAQGDHERALAAVAKVGPLSPLASKATFLGALSEINRQRYDAAFEQLDRLSKVAPAPTVLNNLGVVQLRHGGAPQRGRPTYYFTKAADLAPEDPDYAFNLGYAYWFEGDTKGSLYWLRESVRRNPADADAHFVLGVVLQAGGAGVEGAREKELARHLSSTYSEGRRRPGADADAVPRGLERLRLDIDAPRLSLVERTAAPAEKKDQRELAAFHRDRGRRLVDQLRDTEAMAEFKRSLYLEPYQADVHLLVGQIHARSGRLPEAGESFRISLWCQPTPDAHVALGEVLLQLDDPLGAQTEANRALVLDVRHAAARALLAEATRKNDDSRER